ncbi:hypothetical protein ACXYTJ_08830 [Gilvimarinus sp. F26214L]|uniref:hypothetical protein n=1 Tax=Gilvimarinus sp. DZF01 TaxID=3461371 RepID=UPI00404529AD
MLQKTINNQDIVETLNRRECDDLEEQILQSIDKVQALCAVHTQVETGDSRVNSRTRANFAFVLEDQVNQLRDLLESHFGA